MVRGRNVGTYIFSFLKLDTTLKNSILTGKNASCSSAGIEEACPWTIMKTSMIYCMLRRRTTRRYCVLSKIGTTELDPRSTVDLSTTLSDGVMKILEGPFKEAGEEPRRASSASSAPKKATPYLITPHHNRSSQTENLSGQNSPTTSCPHPTIKRSVSTTTSASPDLAPTAPKGHMSAPFVGRRDTRLSHGSVGLAPTEAIIEIAQPPPLFYPDFSPFISFRPNFDPSLHQQPDLFSRIVCPYNAEAFENFLTRHRLDPFYPRLVHNIRHGFPLGRMPALSSTVIIPNHPSVAFHMDMVYLYLEDELAAGRMSGPFSRSEVERILRGPFHSSPFIVAIQTQAPGVPDKVRICRHLSKATRTFPSVNSFIEKEDFPTRFDTAARVAEVVSYSFSFTRRVLCTFCIAILHLHVVSSCHHHTLL